METLKLSIIKAGLRITDTEGIAAFAHQSGEPRSRIEDHCTRFKDVIGYVNELHNRIHALECQKEALQETIKAQGMELGQMRSRVACMRPDWEEWQEADRRSLEKMKFHGMIETVGGTDIPEMSEQQSLQAAAALVDLLPPFVPPVGLFVEIQ